MSFKAHLKKRAEEAWERAEREGWSASACRDYSQAQIRLLMHWKIDLQESAVNEK